MESDASQAPRPFSPPPPPESAHHRFADAAAAVLRRLALHDDGGPPSPGGSPPTLADRAQAAVNARRNNVAALLDRVMSAAAASTAATMAAAADGGTAAGKESPPPFSPILMPHVLRDALAEEEECADGRRVRKRPPDGLGELLSMVTEAVVHPPTLALALRPDVGLAAYLALDGHSLRVSTLSVAQYLAVKEACAGVRLSLVEQVLGCVEIDLAPFWPRGLPSCAGRPANIGQGVSFINRCLCARLMRGGSGEDGGGPSPGAAALHSYLSNLSLGGTPLALNSRLRSPAALAPAVGRAIAWLETLPDDTPWAGDVAARMADMGFAPGWGASAGRARETLTLLDDALAAPHPSHLEALLARLPGAGQAVVMVSPHGFFAQSGALGKPDTGGQVVYVLDAVRALERELADRAAAAGLLGSDADGGDGAFPPPRIIILTRLIPDAGDTSCNLRREAVEGTNGAVILRVPFRNGGGVVKKWVSRFQVWPFLEQFAVDGASEIMAELGGHAPDLVVGHYTDGGLVASLLVREFGQERTTMAFVAHALEKNKYPQSALRWASPELRAYNFGCHFTADLININRSDFIITSTFQEIAGSTRAGSDGEAGASPGQYEAMAAFAMPGLFRAVDAVSVFDPRFNISSPGADADIYFPYAATDKRLTSLHASLHALVYGPADPDKKASRGYLEEGSGAPLLFSMARLDRVKNLAGLATWFADSPRLQAVCSLLIVGGTVDASAPGSDPEAAEEAAALHALFDSGRLPPGKARWVPQQTNPVRNGELYRLVADGRGAFCLPSLFENFGLTVIEAAASGLPVFVTCHGGPAEIVHDGVEGLHINPYHGSAAADKMAGFFEAVEKDGGKTWEKTSQAALARVASRYNWGTYAARLVTMSRVYSFWRAATRLDAASAARTRYLELIYQLILRPLMARVKPGEDGSGGEGEGGGGTAEPPPSESCRGVCAVALGALADPGRVAPPSGPPSPASGGGGGGGGGVSRRPSSGRAVAGGGSGSGSADGGGGGGGKKGCMKKKD